MRSLAVTLIAVAVIAAASVSAAPIIAPHHIEQQQTVDTVTKSGPVRGVIENNVNRFLGIPFAAPPVGELRWKAPQSPAPWNTTLDATSTARIQKHMCPQGESIGPLYIGSEDCLYLNVYAPATVTETSDLPVMFWMYGGGYTMGDDYEFSLYDGTKLASQHNVVVVTANYRLGPFGFLASDALRDEDPQKSTGNYGTQDQQAAMRWIKENIRAFGGNPDQVTIFGESAGAFSVCWHLVSPASAGLFKNAIMQSGTCESTAFFQPYSISKNLTSNWMAPLGCDQSQMSSEDFLSCIRKLSTANVLQSKIEKSLIPFVYPYTSWGPTIDGALLPGVPLDLIIAGKFNKVPLIIGTNKDEEAMFVPALPFIMKTRFPMDLIGLRKLLSYNFNDSMSSEIMDLYPEKNFSSTTQTAETIYRDFFFLCPSRSIARAFNSHGVPAYLYQFTFNFGSRSFQLFGDYHASELNFVWGNEAPPLVGVWDARHKEMSAIFQQYWTNLARFGDPNGDTNATSVIWPQYDEQTDANIQLDLPLKINTHLQQHECDFWERYQWPRG